MRGYGLALAFICVFAAAQQARPAVIGFLEDHSATDEGIHGPALRVAFMRKGEDWIPGMTDPEDQATLDHSVIPGISGPQTWRVLDHGTPAGLAATDGWSKSRLNCSNGLLHLTHSISFKGQPSSLYGGWTGEARYRPMLALLDAAQARRTAWRRVSAEPGDLPRIWPSFRMAVPTVPRCDGNGEWIEPAPATVFQDMNITASYGDDAGQRLVCAALKQDRVGDCGLPDRSVSDFWFLVAADGKVSPLHMPAGDDAITLTPLEFLRLGGEEVAIFYCSGYDRDGYLLYYAGFKKCAEAFWSYQ